MLFSFISLLGLRFYLHVGEIVVSVIVCVENDYDDLLLVCYVKKICKTHGCKSKSLLNSLAEKANYITYMTGS